MSYAEVENKSSSFLQNIVKKLQEQGIDALICKRPKLINMLTEEKKTI